MTPRTGRERFLTAMRQHTAKHLDSRPLQVMIGTVAGIGTDPSGFTVEVPDHGITLDEDNILVVQSVAQYDQDYDLKVGDSLAVACTAAGDWIALGVMTDAEATERGSGSAAVLSGTGAPSGATGSDGDFYIDTAASAIYGPKAAGAWPAPTSLIGPTGATGSPGSAGSTGPTGPTGPSGASVEVGAIMTHGGPRNPNSAVWQACDGSSQLRAGTFAALFAAITAVIGTPTVTIASPGVFTLAAHGLAVGDPVFLATTGALPTGLVAGTQYFVMTVPTSSTFTLGTTRTLSVNGVPTVTTAVNTTGSQSGVHTLTLVPHGIADTTHFNVPLLAGHLLVASGQAAGLTARTAGVTGGEETHTLAATESGVAQHAHASGGAITGATGTDAPDHAHTTAYGVLNDTAGGPGLTPGSSYGVAQIPTGGASVQHTHGAGTLTDPASGATTPAAAASGHNNMPPFVALPMYIRYA